MVWHDEWLYRTEGWSLVGFKGIQMNKTDSEERSPFLLEHFCAQRSTLKDMVLFSRENSALWDHRIQDHIRRVPVSAWQGLGGCLSLPPCSPGVPDAEGSSLWLLLLRALCCVHRTARAKFFPSAATSASCSDLCKQQLLWLQLGRFETLHILSSKAVERIPHVWHLREDPNDCVHLLCKKIMSFKGNYSMKCLWTRPITLWAQRKEILAAFDLSSLRGSEMHTDILPWAQMQQGSSGTSGQPSCVSAIPNKFFLLSALQTGHVFPRLLFQNTQTAARSRGSKKPHGSFHLSLF